MNKTLIRSFKCTFALFLVGMFIFVFVRTGTDFPAYPRTAPVLSGVQKQMDQSHGIGATFNGGNTFIYFTTLSNVIAIVMIAIEGMSFGKVRVPKKVKTVGMLYMLITGVIFGFCIAPFLAGGHDGFFDLDCVEAHFVVLVGAIGFNFDDKRIVKNTKRDYAGMLVFPIAYLIMSTTIFFATPGNIAVYPFVNFYDGFAIGLPRWASILCTVIFLVLLLGIFILLYGGLSKLNNKVNSKRKTL